MSLALLATCFILKCHFHDPATSDMPFWIRIVVLKWMAQVLRFEIPNKRKRITVDQQEQDHAANLLRKETTKENLDNKPNVTRQTSSLDALLSFVPRRGVHSLVKKLSSSNLVNGNYNSGPKFPHHEDMGSLPRLTVSQVEDWHIASSHVSLSSNEDDDNSEAGAGDEVSGQAFDQRCMAELLKTQEKILEHVQMLCNVVTENEQLQERKDEWNLVAAIFDRAFRIGFLIMFFLLSLTVFYFSMG